MALTATAVQNAKPRAKPYKLADAAGLYLEVMPNGARYWRLRYRYAGKDTRLALGVFPAVSLAAARKQVDANRAILREGRDPGAERKVAKAQRLLSAHLTFGGVADEWLAMQNLAEVTLGKARWQLDLAADLASRPIAEITAPEVLSVLRKVEAAGIRDTAHRVKGRLGQVFRYAVNTGRAQRDPTADLRGTLAPNVSVARAAITKPTAIADLLRALHGYMGQPATAAALKLAPLLFVRPGNLRAMEWDELDLDAAEWRIPAGKMKMREEHVVPLSTQAVAILRALRPLTGPAPGRRGRYCFPSLRTGDRPMSENTLNAALRRLGFDKDTMTTHGFRALASTRLNEMGWAVDVIERQLAHAERNKVRAAYNRAQYMAERRLMMQAWADYLDQLRSDEFSVVPFKRSA